MIFRGLRDYRTDTEGLRSDLRRQNQLLEAAFSNLSASKRERLAPIFVTQGTVAPFGSLVVVDATNAAVTVTLPPASADDAGRSVMVSKSDASGNAVVVAASNATQRVNGSTGTDSSATAGAREFVWDGQGGWWRR